MKVTETKHKETANSVEYLVTVSFGPIEARTLASDRELFGDLETLQAEVLQRIRQAVRAMA